MAEIRDLEQLSKSLGLPLESNEEAVPKAVALEAVLGIEDPGAFEREVGAAEDAGDAEGPSLVSDLGSEKLQRSWPELRIPPGQTWIRSGGPVNGEQAELGRRVGSRDRIEVDGKLIGRVDDQAPAIQCCSVNPWGNRAPARSGGSPHLL